MATKSRLELVPWDTTSEEHVQRMVLQRIACGWDSEAVAGWKEKQESGRMNMQWLVLSESDPSTASKILTHTLKYPQEATPLLDSALTFGGSPRVPTQRTFIPLGHICLGRPSVEYIAAGYVSSDPNHYWIAILYVSRALQSQGLGSMALSTVEGIAAKELGAKSLGLNAINKIDEDRKEKYEALGLDIPAFSNQEWYERKGYVVYKEVGRLFSKVDKTGKTWYWNAVFLRKEI